MEQEVKRCLEKYDDEIIRLFTEIRDIVFSIDEVDVEEKLWAKIPSYYCGDKFVRIIPFKDHINIEAAGLAAYTETLSMYKFTPKGMLQIKAGQALCPDVLKKAFSDTLV